MGKGTKVYAQMNTDTIHLKQKFEGLWQNKKENRYVEIAFNKYEDYITFNDWASGGRESADVYKAYLKGDKIVIYADNEAHKAPYCEVEIVDNKLHYRCNCCLNFTDNFLNKNKPVTEVVFEKLINHKKKPE